MTFELKQVQDTYVAQNVLGEFDVFVVTADQALLYATSPYPTYAEDVAAALRHRAIALRLLPDFLSFIRAELRRSGDE